MPAKPYLMQRREVCDGCGNEVAVAHIIPVLVDANAPGMTGWKFLCKSCRRRQTKEHAA